MVYLMGIPFGVAPVPSWRKYRSSVNRNEQNMEVKLEVEE
jgi:hypothetical protein